ncbi:flavodoxin [Candidatus Photodesmus katoptron Akat1]|uniref:Flavodoxin n=2 Tax=Candidatus Photodesmus anomalopis TaxID=28176 RepID=S3EHL1_9GAMM|nr:flavodoxin [Candidatus Photodesmus katoptron Akat1]
MIKQQFKKKLVHIQDIAKSTKEDIERFSILLFGIPTWYYGEAQCDWEDFFPELESIDFSTKLIAIWGCGDQEDYSEYFCDAMGTMHDIITSKGGSVLGYTSTDGYEFESSKALIGEDEKTFVGLCIDEDRQPELTEKRVKNWVTQIYEEIYLTSNKSLDFRIKKK